MRKLVIVEDERDVRSRIVSLIAKAESSFTVAAEYETGIDAYDGIMSDNPDLILTDIKIPYISGIELVKKVREVFPLVKIIIITGYNEFDCAKEAANLGVVGFISKPVSFEDINAMLKKTEAELDREYLTVANLNRLSDFYAENLPIIRENDLFRLSRMSDVTPAFAKKLSCNNIRLDYPYFVMCVFDFDEIPEEETESYDFAFSSIKKSVGEDFAGPYDFDLFNRYDKLCLLLKSHILPDIGALERRLDPIIQRVGRYSGMPVSVGISNVFENKNFRAMVNEAMHALGYRSVMGGHKVFFFGNAHTPVSKLSFDDGMIKELDYIMHFKSSEACLEWIDQIRPRIGGSRDSLYYAVMGILNVLIGACDDLEGLYARYGGLDSLYQKLFEMKTDDEIYDYLKELTSVIRDLNNGVKVDNVGRNLRMVTAYMEAHFCDPDISFVSLAREVNLSVSYISALLKKKHNTSFVKMLTGLRMEKAKELLHNSSLKILDIAEQLGYSDAYYFSHCFKKQTGMSPKEYRQQ